VGRWKGRIISAIKSLYEYNPGFSKKKKKNTLKKKEKEKEKDLLVTPLKDMITHFLQCLRNEYRIS